MTRASPTRAVVASLEHWPLKHCPTGLHLRRCQCFSTRQKQTNKEEERRRRRDCVVIKQSDDANSFPISIKQTALNDPRSVTISASAERGSRDLFWRRRLLRRPLLRATSIGKHPCRSRNKRTPYQTAATRWPLFTDSRDRGNKMATI